jgi:hypothetical protein
VSDCCLAIIQHFSAISWREQVNLAALIPKTGLEIPKHASKNVSLGWVPRRKVRLPQANKGGYNG